MNLTVDTQTSKDNISQYQQSLTWQILLQQTTGTIKTGELEPPFKRKVSANT